jgi:RNA polymerase sigma factor (sigma-70 family)
MNDATGAWLGSSLSLGPKKTEARFPISKLSGSLWLEMNERQCDFALLREFTRDGRQGAFTTLVRRHLDLVYATALRKVDDAGGAEEIAQNVFSALARKAWQFAPDDSLPAWLHKTALLESKSLLRGELRRRRREQAAAELGTTMTTPDEQPAFKALVPMLDEALLSLREKDRTALLLRYYESHSLRDVGAAFGEKGVKPLL